MNSDDFPIYDPEEAITRFLRSSDSYGFRHTPDLTTVQFLRSRQIPTHQFHDVIFHDTAGQAWNFWFVLYRASDASWSVIEFAANSYQTDSFSATSSVSSDRPWLYLSGNTTSLQETAFPGGEEVLQDLWNTLEGMRASGNREQAQAFLQTIQECLHTVPEAEKIQAVRKTFQEFQQATLGQQQAEGEQQYPFHHFWAYGEVIDHGFDVTQVRLVSSNGLVFEDTVENGLVLFASHQRVPRPLQAELYNRSSELVTRQTVLEPFPFPPNTKFGGFFHPES